MIKEYFSDDGVCKTRTPLDNENKMHEKKKKNKKKPYMQTTL